MTLIRSRGISNVLDVGANTGQYADELRASGYGAKIESFEPIPEAFYELLRKSAPDPLWTAHQLALGDHEGRADLNITAQSPSSSIRPVSPDPNRDHAGARVVQVLSVPMTQLDTLDLGLSRHQTLLKLDVQGYEDAVLRGAKSTLAQVALIECELTIRAMYQDQPLLPDILGRLADAEFRLIALNPGYYDSHTGEILQFDGLFERTNA